MADSGQWADALAIQLIVVTLVLRLLWLDSPAEAVIFDETYYVNAARVILGLDVPEGKPYSDAQAGLDPNTEHMPLGKLLIAGSMRVFGDNALGWRLPSVALGTLAVAVLYLLVRRLSGRPWLALFAAFIFSFDNLAFVHSRIATLDIPMVALMLLAIYAYVVERPALAGSLVALSALAKINGILGLVAIVGFEVMRLIQQPGMRGRWRRSLADLLLVTGTCLVIFLVVLWPLDHFFTAFKSPLDHLAHAYSHGVSLRQDDGPQGIASQPWQWLFNDGAITYYQLEVSTRIDGSVVSARDSVKFMGAMNPYIIAMLPLALGYLVYAAAKTRNDLAILLLALGAATYLQPLATALLFRRISYIFYFLPVLPALCAAIACLLVDRCIPRVVLVVYAVAVLCGFISLFPFRAIP